MNTPPTYLNIYKLFSPTDEYTRLNLHLINTEIKMKKTIIAISLATALLSGCASTDEPVSVAEINQRAVVAQTETYEQSSVTGLEQVRLPINSLFNESVPILNDYIEGTKAFEEGSQLQAAANMKETEEERLEFLDEYKNSEDAGKQKMYQDYIAMINDDHMQSIYKRIGTVSLELATQVAVFSQLDQSTLWTDVDWSDVLDEKAKLAMTVEQIDILTDSFVTLNDEHNNNKAAGLIK